jgi:hypothetical protein
MCLRRAPEKYIAGAALDRADLSTTPWRRMGECKCTSKSILSWLRHLLEPSGQLHALAVLHQGRYSTRYPLDRRLGGSQRRSGRCPEEKVLDPYRTRAPAPKSPIPQAVPLRYPGPTIMVDISSLRSVHTNMIPLVYLEVWILVSN